MSLHAIAPRAVLTVVSSHCFALKTEQFHIPPSTLNQRIKLLNIEILKRGRE